MHSSLKSAINEITRFELFKNLSLDAVHSLCENGQISAHSHKQVVFNFGDSAKYFGVVLTGAYKLTRISPVGEESVIHFSSPGDVVAALIMTQKNVTYPVTVKAMGPSRMLMIPQETYLKTWIQNPQLIIKIQGLLSNRMSRFTNQKIMQRAPMSSKIASMLMQLAAQDKLTTDQLEIPLPLTRKEIADTLGVTVESVIRVMSDWVKQGYISTSDQNIRILSPDKLIEQIDKND